MAVKVHDTQDVERTLPEVAEVGEYARSKVAEEKSRALAAEGELEDQITAEKTRAEAAESTLTENLSKEISDRQAAVEDEAEARASADSSLSQSIQAETQRAEGAEQALQTAVNTKLARVGGTTTNPQVYAKSASGSQQMVDYGTGLVGNGLVQRDANGQVVVPTPTVTTHAVNKQYVDQKVANIDSTTSGLQEAIDAEKTRAMQAESGLQDAIDAEESARASAISELTERVAAEETARQQGDSANNTKIESETTRAQQAEGALQEAIDAEESRATQVENGLSSRLTAVEGKIPAQASAQNQLADKNYVTDLVSKSAADRVTYNQAGDPFPTRNALLTASTFYHAGAVYTPNEHDYALVVADEGAPSPFTGGQTRFEWTGSTWEYAYGINERPFTSEEQAALDSGITAEKVAKIDQKLDKSSTASSLYGTDTSGSQVMVPRSSFATSAQGKKADTAYQKPTGGIPKADLDSTVQSSLNKADSAYQKPTGGITESDLSSSVNQSLDKADSSYQKPASGIPKSDLASDVQTAIDNAESAYHKPEGGITESDLSSSVNASLDKADTAYQKSSEGIPKTDLNSSVQSSLESADAEPALRQAADTALGDRIDDILDGTTPVHDWATEDDIFELAPTSFGETSWSKISALSTAGRAGEFFNVGDEKTIQLTTGEDVTLVILGFNHDDLVSGGKAGITIGMKNLLATTYRMNATATNEGGWDESEMRTSTMATLLSQLPSDLQGVIKQVNKKATAGGASTSITTSADKLWLLAEVEVDGTTDAGYVNEGEQYEYWKTVKDGTAAANRIKYLSNGSGSASDWWLRSPYVRNSTSFRVFYSTGTVGSNLASYTRGVSFGFCV